MCMCALTIRTMTFMQSSDMCIYTCVQCTIWWHIMVHIKPYIRKKLVLCERISFIIREPGAHMQTQFSLSSFVSRAHADDYSVRVAYITCCFLLRVRARIPCIVVPPPLFGVWMLLIKTEPYSTQKKPQRVLVASDTCMCVWACWVAQHIWMDRWKNARSVCWFCDALRCVCAELACENHHKRWNNKYTY